MNLNAALVGEGIASSCRPNEPNLPANYKQMDLPFSYKLSPIPARSPLAADHASSAPSPLRLQIDSLCSPVERSADSSSSESSSSTTTSSTQLIPDTDRDRDRDKDRDRDRDRDTDADQAVPSPLPEGQATPPSSSSFCSIGKEFAKEITNLKEDKLDEFDDSLVDHEMDKVQEASSSSSSWWLVCCFEAVVSCGCLPPER